MIVRGAERCQEHTHKDEQIGPSLARITKRSGRRTCIAPKQEDQAPYTDNGEREIRSHIGKVGDAEKTALVRELVIRLWLRNGGQQDGNQGYCRGERKQEPQTRISRNHRLLSVGWFSLPRTELVGIGPGEFRSIRGRRNIMVAPQAGTLGYAARSPEHRRQLGPRY